MLRRKMTSASIGCALAHHPQNQHCATRRTAHILANTTDKSMITPQDIFRFIFFAFWGGILFLLVIVWWVVYKCSEPGKAWRNNIIATVVVLGSVLAWIFIPSADERRLNREAEIRRQNRLKSRAVFEELCKTAGEKIYRTADNVEGVTLLKVWNDESVHSEDKLWKYAGLPEQYGQDGYIRGFLKWKVKIIPKDHEEYNDVLFSPKDQNHPYILQGRYSYVDVKQNDENNFLGTLPLIENENVKFERFYYLNEEGNIIFKTILDDNIENEEILLNITYNELKGYFEKIGFRNIKTGEK